MTEIDPKYLKHQYLYVPWVESKDIIAVGKALGLYVAQHYKARLTVICATKQNASYHIEFAKLPIVTERSGAVVEGGMVLAWCPTRKVMDKVHHLEKSVVILVEWSTESYAAWAKLVGAYNVVTGEVMTSGLTDAGMKALEGVVWEGYNGWHDDIAATMTAARLKELAESDGYDREIVLEYASRHRGHHELERLEKILDKLEKSLPVAA